MSDVINSPNMNLPVPIVGQDPGPDWANNYNSCLSVVDGHNHASGSGVQITQSGINLIAAATTFDSLGFNTSNATDLRSVRFTPQGSPLALGTDVGCLYESGVDLYYNDGSGNQVQITSGGMVNATSSGISGGTATAAFVANVLIVNQNTNTPGNIKCGSVFIGNNTVSSNYVEVSAPNALASNYQLVLPAIPGGLNFMTLDASGNMGTASSVSAAQIATSSITGAQIVSGATLAGTVTTGGLSTGNISSSGLSTGNISSSGLITLTSSGSILFGTTNPRPIINRFAINALSVEDGGSGSNFPIVVSADTSQAPMILRFSGSVASAGSFPVVTQFAQIGMTCEGASAFQLSCSITPGLFANNLYSVVCSGANVGASINSGKTTTNFTLTITGNGLLDIIVIGDRNT